jgi:hypothetical protein
VVRGFELPFLALRTQDEGGATAVAVFGQVRPGRGTQTVEIQRRGPGGRWATVPSRAAGRADAGSCGAFPTDGQGLYARVVPDQGPGTYRARWLEPGGDARVSPATRVSSPLGVPGGADGVLRRVGDDGRTPAR